MSEFVSKLVYENNHYYLLLADKDIPKYIEDKRVSLSMNSNMFIDDFDFKTHKVNNHYLMLMREEKMMTGDPDIEEDEDLIKDLEAVYYPDQDNASYTRFIIDDLIRKDEGYFLNNDDLVLSIESEDITVNIHLTNELEY